MPEHRTSLAARVALVALTAIVVAWLAVGLRSAIPFTDAKGVLASDPSPARVDSALEQLRDSRSLNPDTEPRLVAAQARVLQGRSREAASIARPVVVDEPDNADAWAVLLAAYRRYDRPRAADAERRLRALRPPVGG